MLCSDSSDDYSTRAEVSTDYTSSINRNVIDNDNCIDNYQQIQQPKHCHLPLSSSSGTAQHLTHLPFYYSANSVVMPQIKSHHHNNNIHMHYPPITHGGSTATPTADHCPTSIVRHNNYHYIDDR